MKSMTVWMLAALALAWTSAGCKKEAPAPAASEAAPAAAPAEEPPVVMRVSQGFRVKPVSGLSPRPFQPNSGSVVLAKGTAPASISRAMTALITEQHYARVRNFKQLLSSFQRNRDLVSVGAYAKGSDPMLDKAISLWPQLEAFLQQGIFERADWEDSIQALELIFPQV